MEGAERNGAERVIGVTGATGLLGGAWLQRVLERERNVRVIALVRSARAAGETGFRQLTAEQRDRVELVEADLARLVPRGALRAAAERVTLGWWHFAAVTSLASDPAAERAVQEVNVEGTRKLLELVGATRPEVPVFHLSTAYVAGVREGPVREVRHESACFRNPYERSKALAEEYVARFFSEGGRGAIFRPSIVVGREARSRGQLPDLCRHALTMGGRAGAGELVLRLPPTGGLNLVPLTWVVECLLALTARPASSGQIYHLTAAEDVPLATLLAWAEAQVPNLRVRCEPDAAPETLSPVARLLDRWLADARQYFVNPQIFDRTEALRALPAELHHPRLDLGELRPAKAPPEVELQRRAWSSGRVANIER